MHKAFLYSVYLFCMLLVLTACGQTKEEMNIKFNQIKNLHKKIQHYPSEPIYTIEANQSGCFYELYVNDILFFKHFEQTGLLGHTISINDAILRSGKQEVTVKLYPLGQTEVERFDTFTKNARIEVKIEKYDIQVEDSDEKVVTLKIPEASARSKNDIKIEGLPYYEHTFTFNAEVPYKIKGWSESQDLTKMDQKVLEERVLHAYKEYRKLFVRKNAKQIEDITLTKEFEIAQSNYFYMKNSKELAEEYSSYLDFIEVLPIENYEMKLYANGKIVKLESKQFENVNNNSALISINEKKYDNELVKMYLFHGLSFHLPKGSNKLEIIR
ncbi:hypothetical protein ABMY20_11995 [Tenacibaculum sp. SSH1-16]|nr:hypothetical protein BACT7_13770 [Tenacibaculum mesophilum]